MDGREGGKQGDLTVDELEDHPPTLSLWLGKEREVPVEVEKVWTETLVRGQRHDTSPQTRGYNNSAQSDPVPSAGQA